MLRAILGVIVGYVVMALLIFATFSAAYLLMGAEASFKPGSYEVSALWLIVSFVLAFIAAMVGGYVCASLSKSGRAPLALAVMVIVLGVLAAVPALMAKTDAAAVRTGDVPNMQAMMSARQPNWAAVLYPFFGAAAVLIGARLKRRT